jgi:XRE family aerobic/anaerobic benzoate catabolism transcriptional regulator
MAGNNEAMDDLRRLLAGRAPFYAKADIVFNTSNRSLDESFEGLRHAVVTALATNTAAAD